MNTIYQNRFPASHVVRISISLTLILFPTSTYAEKIPTKIQVAIAAANKFLKNNPEIKSRLLPPDYDEKNTSKEIISSYRSSNSEIKYTRLNSVKNVILDLGLTLTADRSKQNLLSVYRKIYSALPKKYKKRVTPFLVAKELPLINLRKKTRDMLRLVHFNLTGILKEINPTLLNPLIVNPIGDCSQELGYEVAGNDSEESARCDVSSYRSNGLFSNISFPLKNNLTCIKDQGRRGTCVAHAIAAYVESLRLGRSNIAKNLSEQHIYYTGETVTESSYSLYDMQTYGLSGGSVLDDYDHTRLPIYYERDWNYNRSSFISPQSVDPVTTTFIYQNSCSTGYAGESCNQYTWQTGATVNLPGVPVPDSFTLGGALSTEKIKNHGFIIADGAGGAATSIALSTAILLNAVGAPVFLSFVSTDALQASTNGYVLYDPSDTARGGHAVEIIGYVPNSQVPASAPQATEEGFFIVKNSWGIDSGDCGFYYLDYGYVRRFMSYISFFDLL